MKFHDYTRTFDRNFMTYLNKIKCLQIKDVLKIVHGI